jgi:rare lipoprotein A
MRLRQAAAARWIVASALIVLLGASTTAYVIQCPADISAATPAALQAAPQAVVIPLKAAAPKLTACIDRRKMRLGYASWYGATGNRTASGEVFDEHELTAASRSLPFNTQIRVTNLRNGRSVVVRVNDRGPFVHKRVIDLTPRAAQLLGMTNRGIAPVYMEIVPRPDPKVEARGAATELLATAR